MGEVRRMSSVAGLYKHASRKYHTGIPRNAFLPVGASLNGRGAVGRL
jgi:hypothetical protein